MGIPNYQPFIFLRCRECSGRTGHVLIKTAFIPVNNVAEEIYECQECGEIKKIYEFAFLLSFPSFGRLTNPAGHFSK